MKNPLYEARRNSKWVPGKMIIRLSRAALVKAFSAPGISRQQTMDIVTRYMGDSPIPPVWGYAGVRGTFGKRAARMWAKKLRHRESGVYRDHKSGRWIHPVIQSIHDFSTGLEGAAAKWKALQPKRYRPMGSEKVQIFMDEAHLFNRKANNV